MVVVDPAVGDHLLELVLGNPDDAVVVALAQSPCDQITDLRVAREPFEIVGFFTLDVDAPPPLERHKQDVPAVSAWMIVVEHALFRARVIGILLDIRDEKGIR